MTLGRLTLWRLECIQSQISRKADPTYRCTKIWPERRVGIRFLKQTIGKLHTQDAGHGIIDPRHRDCTIRHKFFQGCREQLVFEWQHELQ